MREREAVPARGEDVREEGEGAFVRGAGGEFEGVEVGEGDAEVLGLWLVSQELDRRKPFAGRYNDKIE